MTDLAAIQTRAVAGPSRVGQGTAVEQSRAVAEVQAAVIVAQQVPRSTALAISQMEDACRKLGMAERAFYRFSRGDGTVTGPTVHLARELARCWGNIQYGVVELRRDDEARQSEMQAWAWDVQTNARASTTFIVPHRRERGRGTVDLTGDRDVYENNANMGARRLREQIMGVLPQWYVDQAVAECRATLERGEDGKTIEQRRAVVVGRFGDLGVALADLERKLGRSSEQWTAQDIADLTVIGRSLAAGETTRDEEFPPVSAPVTADEVIAKGRRPKPAPEVDAATGEVIDAFPEATA